MPPSVGNHSITVAPRSGLISRRRALAIWGAAASGLLLDACTSSPPEAPKPAVTPTALFTPAAPAQASPAAQASPPVVASPATVASPGVAASPSVASAPAAPRVPAASGKTLRLLSWQAPTNLNPYLSGGQADLVAARCCLEPLLTVDNAGTLEAVLAAEVPSRENGGLPDARTVVYHLKPGLTWADGRPLTSADVAFTYQFVANPETAAATTAPFQAVQAVDAIDPLTVKITFKEPTGGWNVPFVGATGLILPRHAFDGFAGAAAKSAPFNMKPFGTGPYVVDDFAPGDHVTLVANPSYRQADRLGFGRIELKGGGDAVTAARAVLQTGEYDYAWNLQVEGPVLQQIADSGKGQLVTAPGAGLELVMLNQADPNVEVGGERSAPSTRHPFLTDPAVRQAMTLAIDRPTLARVLYSDIAGSATANLLTTPTDLAWPGASIDVDVDRANRLLDEAGYQRGSGGIRMTPGGAPLKIVFATTVSSLRQKEQAIIKDGWQKIGIDTELKAVESSSYFSTATNNPDALVQFGADVEMFTIPFTSPFPAALMKRFYGRDHARDWAQKANEWSPANIAKWDDPEYNRVYEQVLTETDPGRARDLWRRLDELVVTASVAIPLVDRRFVAAKVTALNGPSPRAFDVETWNVAEWSMA